MSYLDTRLKALEITPEKNSIRAHDIDSGHQISSVFFSSDKNDNIVIHYYNPSGEFEVYEDSKSGKLKHFQRTRNNPANNPANKYTQNYKSGLHVFTTPLLMDLYKRGEKVQDLFLTEGEFKAFALDNMGVPCFGLGGINSYCESKKHKLNDYIIEFIKKCSVENVFMIYDSDLFTIKWEADKELKTRAAGFCSSVRTLAELLKPYNVNFYMSHVKEDSKYKGIDDLLYSGEADRKTIIHELCDLYTEEVNVKDRTSNRKYINTYAISGKSAYYINSIFSLNSVQDFYDYHKQELENRDFVFSGITYYADANGKVTQKKDDTQKKPQNYIMVGDDFFEFVAENIGGTLELSHKLRKKSTVLMDIEKKQQQQFLSQIPKFNCFTYEPENDPAKYQRKVTYKMKLPNGFEVTTTAYNKYMPVNHKPKQGEFPTIEKLLHHIFDYPNTKGEPLYEFILDYMQILYTNPKQKLPVICLVSNERETGKSTFLDFMHAIYGENMKITKSSQMSEKFNSLWGGKLIVAIDETLIQTDKDEVVNTIKALSTNQTVTMEAKGREAETLTNYTHLIMCSNHEDNFLKIDNEENRFWVVKVPPIPDGERNPKMLDDLKNEIPAFLYFLTHRKLKCDTPKSRLYFAPEDFTTEQLNKVKERNEPAINIAIKEVLKDQFFRQHKEEIKISIPVLKRLIEPELSFKIDMRKIKYFFEDRGYKLNSCSTINYVEVFAGEETTKQDKNRYYRVNAADILKPDEFNELQKEIEEYRHPAQEEFEF